MFTISDALLLNTLNEELMMLENELRYAKAMQRLSSSDFDNYISLQWAYKTYARKRDELLTLKQQSGVSQY